MDAEGDEALPSHSKLEFKNKRTQISKMYYEKSYSK